MPDDAPPTTPAAAPGSGDAATPEITVWAAGRRRIRIVSLVATIFLVLVTAVMLPLTLARQDPTASEAALAITITLLILAAVLAPIIYWALAVSPIVVDSTNKTIRIGKGEARPWKSITYAHSRVERQSLMLRFGFSPKERTTIIKNVVAHLDTADGQVLAEVLRGSGLPAQSTVQSARAQVQTVLLSRQDAVRFVSALVGVARKRKAS